MTNREMKKRIRELEQEVSFLRVQLAAAQANKIVVVPASPVNPAPFVPQDPWRPNPYIGDPLPGSGPTITCKSNMGVNSNPNMMGDLRLS